MARLQQHFLDQIVNVHWDEPRGFLYSGADGMFGSRDGKKWKEAPLSVPATSLAWVDDVWVGCNPDVGCWYSEDDAKTWIFGGLSFVQVVAMKPSSLDEEGKPKPGMFAGFLNDDDNGVVYTSSDGKSWSPALTIPIVVGEDGSEAIGGISGCGGAFFVGTAHKVNSVSDSSAKFYSSFEGGSFSSQTVATGTFWNGDIENVPDVFTGYGAAGVGFDKKTEMYLATIQKQVRPSFGVIRTYMQASQSAGGSFDEGAAVASGSIVSSEGDFISVYPYVAGGDAIFAGGSALRRFSVLQTGGEVRAHWLPGATAQTLESYEGETSDEFIGSFCFNKLEEDSEDRPPVPGVFACVAYGADAEGGVFIAEALGAFHKAHSGTGIVGVRGQPAGAVAVGNLGGWVDSPEEA